MENIIIKLKKEHKRLEELAIKYFDAKNFKRSDHFQYRADGIAYSINIIQTISNEV